VGNEIGHPGVKSSGEFPELLGAFHHRMPFPLRRWNRS
jgi:hypothetical protein